MSKSTVTSKPRSNNKQLLIDMIAVIGQYPGIKMTVRQVYYRLVAAQKIPNSFKSYTKVKTVLGKARKDGIIPFDAIEDRGRAIHTVTDATRVSGNQIYLVRRTEEEVSVKNFEEGFLRTFKLLDEYYDLPRWYGQETRIIVLVEKQALQGLFENVCDELQVDLLVCRGYPSLSIMNDLAKRLRDEKTKEIKLLYFGDYDPSGLDIDRDVQSKLRYQFQIDFEFERMAIVRDQIDLYDIPPAPAKTSDSRYESMVENEGEAMQVELDAIDPPVLKGIIREAVEEYFDKDIYDNYRADELEKRKAEVEAWIPTILR